MKRAEIDFATFHSRNEETTSFLDRKEIAVSFLVLENPLFRIFFN